VNAALGGPPLRGGRLPALERATLAHHATFGSPPTLAAQAPGRVNLIGEHTDYNDGFVLPIAIDRRCIAVASPGPGRVLAADLNETRDLTPDLSPRWGEGPGAPPKGHWSRYVQGVAHGVRNLTKHPLPTLDITLASDVPMGAGLSSSAALEVSLAYLLLAAAGDHADPLDVARLCRQAEHDYAGVPCGIMDQLIAVLARQGHALFIDCQDERTAHFSLPDPDIAIIVVMDTGVRHSLASGEYAARKASCERVAAALGRPSLRGATPRAIAEANASEDDRRIASHVPLENARVAAFVAALGRGELGVCGELMRQSHASLRDLSRVSCPALDALGAAAAGVPGVYGARMTGGGFGGCAVALARPGATSALMDAARHEGAVNAFVAMPAAGAGLIAV